MKLILFLALVGFAFGCGMKTFYDGKFDFHAYTTEVENEIGFVVDYKGYYEPDASKVHYTICLPTDERFHKVTTNPAFGFSIKCGENGCEDLDSYEMKLLTSKVKYSYQKGGWHWMEGGHDLTEYGTQFFLPEKTHLTPNAKFSLKNKQQFDETHFPTAKTTEYFLCYSSEDKEIDLSQQIHLNLEAERVVTVCREFPEIELLKSE